MPYAVWKDIVLLGVCPSRDRRVRHVLRSVRPDRPARPDDHPDRAEADFFFLWLYAVLSLLPPSLETPALLIGPVVVIVVLLLLPFLSGEGEKSWRRRPIAVLTVLLIAVALGTFTRLAEHAPWSPHDERVERRPDARAVSSQERRPWSDKARSCFRPSSAATAMRSTAAEASGVRRSTASPCGSRRISSSAR